MTVRPKRAAPASTAPGAGDMQPNIIRGALNDDIAEVQAALVIDSSAINTQDFINKSTALHIAAGKSNLRMVDFLLAQPQLLWGIKDRLGRDAHDIAILAGHPGVIKSIVRYRANRPPDEKPKSLDVKSADVLPFKPS